MEPELPSAPPRRRFPMWLWLLGIVGVALVVGTAGIVAGASNRNGDWPCEQLISMTGDLVGTGQATRRAAEEDGVHALVTLGMPATLDEGIEALDHESGATSYDRTTGNLYVEGVLVGRFAVEELPDETFRSIGWTTCASA